MANRKISELTALTAPASGDYLPIVDISEAAAADKNKRITVEELLRGAPDGTNGAPGIAFEADPDSGFYRTGANAIAISTGGTGRLFIDASGNVGINTAPSARLHIVDTDSSSAYTTGAILGTQTSIYKQIVHTDQSSGTNEAGIVLRAGASSNIAEWGLSAQRTGATSGDLIFRTRTGASSSNEFVRITSGGNVGIKTNAPNGELDVTGTGDANGGVLVVNDAGAIGVEVVSPQPTILLNETDTTDENYQIRLNSGDLLIQTQTDARTGASTKVTIDSLGKVGIGIAPSRRLSVQNSAVGTEGIALYRNTGDGTLMVGLAQDADGHGEIGVNNTSGTRKVQIRGNGTSYFNGGNVGIATTDPQNLLSLGLGSGTTTRILGQYGNNVSTTLEVGAGQASTFRGGMRIAVTDTVAGSVGDSVVSFHTTKDGGGTVQRLTIDEDGKVGIGTTDPLVDLHLHGQTSGVGPILNLTNNTGDCRIFFGQNTTAGSANAAGQIRYNVANNTMAFYTNLNERARIDSSGTFYVVGAGTGGVNYAASFSGSAPVNSLNLDSSGNLLVGTASTRAIEPYRNTTAGVASQVLFQNANAALTIVGTDASNAAYGPSLYLARTRGSQNQAVASGDSLGGISFAGGDDTDIRTRGASIDCEVDGTPGANDMPGRLVFSTTADGASSPTERMRIAQSGLVSIPGVYSFTTAAAANVYVESAGQLSRATSSSKYKTNVETIEDVYADALLDCRPVWYRSTCANDNPGWGWWGFIAEEVAEIDPRLVHWKTTEVTYDEKGSVVETPCNPEPEGVMYDRFVPHLLNLIKRQQQAIETLEARVAALESA